MVGHLQACRCESPWTVDLGHFARNRQEIAETGAAKEKEKQEAGRRWSSKRCDTGSKPQRDSCLNIRFLFRTGGEEKRGDEERNLTLNEYPLREGVKNIFLECVHKGGGGG